MPPSGTSATPRRSDRSRTYKPSFSVPRKVASSAASEGDPLGGDPVPVVVLRRREGSADPGARRHLLCVLEVVGLALGDALGLGGLRRRRRGRRRLLARGADGDQREREDAPHLLAGSL